MTDTFRAMCAELSELDGHCVVDCTEEWADAMCRLRALLAQPVAEGPSDEEIEEWADACPDAPLEEMDPEIHGWRRCFTAKEFSETIRAALDRWGRPTPQPETNAFAIVQQRLEQLAGDQELMLYRWPADGQWEINHTNPSSFVQLGEVSGEYGCTGRTLEEAVCKLAELLSNDADELDE